MATHDFHHEWIDPPNWDWPQDPSSPPRPTIDDTSAWHDRVRAFASGVVIFAVVAWTIALLIAAAVVLHRHHGPAAVQHAHDVARSSWSFVASVMKPMWSSWS
jgi:hypothetical protein